MDIQSPIIVTNLTLSGSVSLTPESQASLVGQLTGSLDQNYIVSGSLTQTTWENITGKPEGIVSSSNQVQLSNITGTTFSSGNFTFLQDITVQGKVTAQEFHTEFISSSVIYQSGSTKFGDTEDDVHSFTGSLQVLGTVSATSFSGIISSSAQVNADTVTNFDSNVLSYINTLGVVSGSVSSNFNTLTNNPFTSSTAITASNSIVPSTNATLNLGSAAHRWNIVYTSDLSLKNDRGDWTIVEGEDDLFLYNNKRDKVYKFNLTEVDPSIAPPKKE